MKTIVRSVAVALLTAGAVVVPASAEAIAAPLHVPASVTLAAHGGHHGPHGYRHDADLWRYRGDGRGYWGHGNYRYGNCGRDWDDCAWDRHTSSHYWDCYPSWRR
ncbi:hypothetical protein [Streptomyces cyslabdanicus]|uniref:hypothetical protein n=1 Tax=Streptomyces cyslabdanicus TaxID=1470456 RepID=UPI004044DB51